MPVKDIVVYADSYDEEFYEALQKFDHLMGNSFDSLKSQAVLLDTATSVGKHDQNVLSAVLADLGYTL